MSDAELLDQTAEWLSRLAETIERVTERLVDSISKLQAEQERQADEIRVLSNRAEAMSRAYHDLEEYARETREAFPGSFA